MAGQVLGGTPEHNEFHKGYGDRHAPLLPHERKMIRFATKSHADLASRNNEILTKFGMYPPEFYHKVEGLKNHPRLSTRSRNNLGDLFPNG